MRIIPKFLRRKPTPEPVIELPKNTWDYSYITAIHTSVAVTRIKGLDINTMDCTDKAILRFLQAKLDNPYSPLGIVRDMQSGVIFPDFSLNDLALFFHRHIIK